METSSLFDTLGAQIATTVGDATGLLADNAVYLLAVPVGFVAFKMVKRLIAKIGG